MSFANKAMELREHLKTDIVSVKAQRAYNVRQSKSSPSYMEHIFYSLAGNVTEVIAQDGFATLRNVEHVNDFEFPNGMAEMEVLVIKRADYEKMAELCSALKREADAAGFVEVKNGDG